MKEVTAAVGYGVVRVSKVAGWRLFLMTPADYDEHIKRTGTARTMSASRPPASVEVYGVAAIKALRDALDEALEGE